MSCKVYIPFHGKLHNAEKPQEIVLEKKKNKLQLYAISECFYMMHVISLALWPG